jgi:hypothetical protein
MRISNGVQYASTMRLLRRCRRFATATCDLQLATCGLLSGYLALSTNLSYDYHDGCLLIRLS